MIERPSEQAGLGTAGDLRELIESFFRTEFSTDNALITEAVRRMLSAGGKRMRPRLTLLAAEANGADARDHLALASYMELIHVATLIHDDVVDRADTRRGVNATAIDFGNRVSVLAGDYLFAWIFRNVTANYPHPVPNILSATLAEITDGEVLQLKALRNLDLPIASYVEIAMKKTASLFAASAECGAIMGGGTPLRIKALRDFGLYYGIAFQMLDDVLDFSESQDELGKPVGNDVRERKMTLPVILALDGGDPAVRTRFAAVYASDDDAGIEALVSGVIGTGALERSAGVIDGYVARAKQSLAPLGNARARSNLIELADALAERARDSVRKRH
jgi:geranylgeranyl pyrophosphate synthase